MSIVEKKIPKIIHYCWFGNNEKPKLVKRCIETWYDKLKGYEIIEWNEDNFPIDYCDYVKEAYDKKKYAFVSDVARLYALEKYGGFYFDTDIEVLKNLDDYLTNELLCAFESKSLIMTGFFGACKNNSIIKELLNSYKNKNFIKDDGALNNVANTVYFTDLLRKYGLVLNGKRQVLNENISVYPLEIFGAFDCDNSMHVRNENTVLIHWCAASWGDNKFKIKFKIKRILAKVLGKKNYMELKKFIKKIIK